MMRLLKGMWRVLSGISRAISVLVPLLFVAIFVIAFNTKLSESTPVGALGRGLTARRYIISVFQSGL